MKRTAFFTALLAAYNTARSAVVDPVRNTFNAIKDADLTDALRPAMNSVRDGLNRFGAALTELPADVQVALNGQLDTLVNEELAARLPGEVQTALNGKLTDGTYVKKSDSDAALQTALNAARQDERTKVEAEFAAQAARKEKVTACGLTVTDPAVLAGTDAEFDTRLELAKTRKGEREKLSLNGKCLGEHLDVFAAEDTWKASFNSAKSALDSAAAAVPGARKGDLSGSGKEKTVAFM